MRYEIHSRNNSSEIVGGHEIDILWPVAYGEHLNTRGKAESSSSAREGQYIIGESDL